MDVSTLHNGSVLPNKCRGDFGEEPRGSTPKSVFTVLAHFVTLCFFGSSSHSLQPLAPSFSPSLWYSSPIIMAVFTWFRLFIFLLRWFAVHGFRCEGYRIQGRSGVFWYKHFIVLRRVRLPHEGSVELSAPLSIEDPGSVGPQFR